MAEAFSKIAAALERLLDGLVLDGELVVPGPAAATDLTS